jgi:hypothetical protein
MGGGDPLAHFPAEPSLGPDGLEMLAAAHIDLRAALDRVARDGPDRAVAAALARTLPAALAVHVAEEERALFPALLAAASPEDGLAVTLERLTGEHAGLAAAAEGAAAALARIGAGQDGPADRAALRAFCAAKRRHIAFEAAVILPLARARLDPTRRLALAERIAALRGVCLVPRAVEAARA